MDTSTLVNIILCILSFILSAISVVTVVLTLKQNHRMIENSTRPYIGIYGTHTYVQNISYYIVVKNFGASSANILKFDYDMDLSKCNTFNGSEKPFSDFVSTVAMPGQSFMANIDLNKALELNDTITFSIKYSCGKKIYSEKIVLNLKADFGNLQSRATTKNKELDLISRTLQDINTRFL